MKNTVMFGREYFKGSASQKFDTSPAMGELMKNPKIASVLLDRVRQRDFFEALSGHLNSHGEIDTDSLRAVFGELYAGNSHVSKGSVERIADALLTENRDPKYFTYPEKPEAKKEQEPEKDHESVHEMKTEAIRNTDTTEPGAQTEKHSLMKRIFG